MQDRNENCRPASLWRTLMTDWLSANNQLPDHVARSESDHGAHTNDNFDAQAA
jgi:hypothetical protein